ncbi:hypothetical protein LMB68_03250 [Limosilactobacillus reuteri]|uniref:sunset domain-containing protein n=1 Tax=Limosilactobacillus reuteri TaxID=1598 RepID=UPI001E582803|nr:hypothetical protein [Limosilactobacillus reuteri]MCC4413346.1 hypothetical protein [Limosilactobacillus reuteri]MDK8117543.1 hypothetical protein [Limosilactobacillus reuteri]
MKNKGTIWGGIFLLAIIIWLFKYLMLLGALVSLGAIIYYGIKATKDETSRKMLLLQRVLPAFVLFLVCGGIFGAMSGDSKTVSQSASSAKVSSSSSSKKEESSSDENDDESVDDESDSDSSDDYDNSSNNSNDGYDTSDEESSTATSNDNNDTDTDTAKGDMETDQQGTIVGNSRTMVYHTPDQQGYRMNSANAVYFNTEAEAQAAGYRKSAR